MISNPTFKFAYTGFLWVKCNAMISVGNFHSFETTKILIDWKNPPNPVCRFVQLVPPCAVLKTCGHLPVYPSKVDFPWLSTLINLTPRRPNSSCSAAAACHKRSGWLELEEGKGKRSPNCPDDLCVHCHFNFCGEHPESGGRNVELSQRP